MDSTAARYRELMLETVAPYADRPLILSGGVDSSTILAAQLALGVRPICYSFALGVKMNPDLSMARRMTAEYGLTLREVRIPQSRAQLVGDVLYLIRTTGTTRKTVIQCAHPMLYVAKAIRWDAPLAEDVRAIVGTGAVVLDDRRVMVTRGRDGEEAARAYRKAKLDDRYDLSAGTGWMHQIAVREGVTLEEPYSDEPLRSFALALDIAELAKGPDGRNWQKGIAARAFPEFWEPARGWWRSNSSFQIATGIRAWHDEVLLGDPELNPGGRFQRVIAVYNRMAKEMEDDRLPV